MQPDISLASGVKLCAGHAVYCRDDETLAIGDLHLGYEAALQAEHVAIPRFQLEPMLERLRCLLERYRPELVVINGDLKHDFGRNKGQEWDEVNAVLDVLADTDVVVVRGNHDNYLKAMLAPRGIPLEDSFAPASGRITFRHGHKILPDCCGLRIYAHEHPAIRLRDEVGAQVTLPCFLHDPVNQFLIMPAFSPLASGINVTSPGTKFMNPALRRLDIAEARVFAIHDGVMDFGRVGDLRDMGEDYHLDSMKPTNRG